jgi:hypothetical protein
LIATKSRRSATEGSNTPNAYPNSLPPDARTREGEV